MLKKLFAFFAILIGTVCFDLLFIFIFINSTLVDCTLQSNEAYTCETRTLLLGRVQTFEHKYEQVVDIKLESDSCDDGCSYRAEFVTRDGSQYPLSEVFTDRGPAQEPVQVLRPQMQQRVESINYRMDPAWWMILLIGGLSVMGILLSPLVFLGRN